MHMEKNWEHYFGTPEKAAEMSMVDVTTVLACGAIVVMRNIYQNGTHVAIVPVEDYDQWMHGATRFKDEGEDEILKRLDYWHGQYT